MKGKSFQRKHELYSYPFLFHSSITFLVVTVFISGQITEYMFGRLLEISDELHQVKMFLANDFAVLAQHFGKFQNTVSGNVSLLERP